MKLWLISYDGVYLGGSAVVWAHTADEAIETLRKDPRAFGAEKAEAKELKLLDDTPTIIYHDDGDY